MSLEELLNTYYDRLNENDLYIWEYIRHHKQECENASIEQLASKCNVSRSTILRFAQKLSLKGFGELKLYLKWEKEHQPMSRRYIDQVGSVYNDLFTTIRDKDCTAIFEMLDHASNLFVYGTGEVQENVAKELKRNFSLIGVYLYEIGANDEAQMVAEQLGKDDLVIIVSLTGESSHVKEFAKKLKIKGVPLISITKRRDNTLAQLSDENLYITTLLLNEISYQAHVETTTGYFMLVELLFLKYLEYQEQKKKVEEA